MKIRTSYVSNSSSSSFILMNDNSISHLTANDWLEMLKDLYHDGNDNYEQAYQKHLEYVSELKEQHPDWYKYEEDKDRYFAFCVYDLESNRGEADKVLGNLLKYWIASNVKITKNGKMNPVKRNQEILWHRFCENLEDSVEQQDCNNTAIDKGNKGHWNRASIFYYNGDIEENISNSEYRIFADGKCYSQPLPEAMADEMRKKWKQLGICSNRDVLMNEKSKFVVHFDENDYCLINGVCDNEGNWETDCYSFERLCEVFTNWFIAHGKLPKGFDWRKMVDLAWTVNMHEG